MLLRLLTADSKLNPDAIDLPMGSDMTLGRDRTDIRVMSESDPTSISRKHARVGADECGVWVVDESTNGLMVNLVVCNVKKEKIRLNVGDKVTFGSNTQELTYEVEEHTQGLGVIHGEVLIVADNTQEVKSLADIKRGQELLHTSCDDQDLDPVSATTQPVAPPQMTPQACQATQVITYLLCAYNPSTHTFTHTLPPEKLAEMILSLVDRFCTFMEPTPSYVTNLKGPMYVLGDLHGSFYDLKNYVDLLTPFGDIRYTAVPLVFLGDYVDRGSSSLEVVLYLFAMKMLCPENIVMFRGNHEDQEVNCDEELMGETSFVAQCRKVLGKYGEKVWRAVNKGFAELPVCGLVGGKIFLCHGGVPRGDVRDMKSGSFRKMRSVLDADDERTRLVRDLLWSDPAEEDPGAADMTHTPSDRCNDGSVVNFTNKALDAFMATNNISLLVRAHQFQPKGLRVSKHGRVLTLFSTTTYQTASSAGILLITPQHTAKLVSYAPSKEQKKRCFSSESFSNSVTLASLKSNNQLDDVG